jgi:hypothetical protein
MVITKVEVAKLLTVIAAMYPRFEVNDLKINLWHEMIGDLSYQVAQMALKKTMLTSVYPPTVADIRAAVADITEVEQLDAGKAWGEVTRAISRWGFYEPSKAYELMSPLTLQVVKQLSWREICMAEEIGVTRGQFMKMYDSMKKREETNKLLPASFKNQILELTQSFSMGRLSEKNEK